MTLPLRPEMERQIKSKVDQLADQTLEQLKKNISDEILCSKTPFARTINVLLAEIYNTLKDELIKDIVPIILEKIDISKIKSDIRDEMIPLINQCPTEYNKYDVRSTEAFKKQMQEKTKPIEQSYKEEIKTEDDLFCGNYKQQYEKSIFADDVKDITKDKTRKFPLYYTPDPKIKDLPKCEYKQHPIYNGTGSKIKDFEKSFNKFENQCPKPNNLPDIGDIF